MQLFKWAVHVTLLILLDCLLCSNFRLKMTQQQGNQAPQPTQLMILKRTLLMMTTTMSWI